jgi:chemotaxis signal transduction protein
MFREPQFEDGTEVPLIAAESSESTAEAESTPERQYCVFRAGRERYCLSVLEVEEVVDWPPVTPLPLAPSFLMGIFNLRGAIVPIIDISIGEGRRPDLPPRRVVVARWSGQAGRDDVRLGIAADEVIGTCSTQQPLLVEEAPRDMPHCCGMLRHATLPAMASGAVPQVDRLALALDLTRVVETFPVPAI